MKCQLNCGGKMLRRSAVMRALRCFLFAIVLAFLAMILAGCGEESPTTNVGNFFQETPEYAGEPLEAFDPYSLDTDEAINIEGFALFVVDETNQVNKELQSLYSLSKTVLDDGEVMLTISVQGSPGIPHSLLYIRYNDEELNPRLVQLGGFFGEKNEYISLVSQWLPGVVSMGIARIHPEKGMPSGDGVIATIAFDSEPFDKKANKRPSKAPVGDDNRTQLSAHSSNNRITLSWTELNVGDYDNSGDVGIPDITPIALYFGNIVGDGVNDYIDIYVDGDKNLEVGISDITPIAENYLSVLSGYRVYRTRAVGSPDYTDPFLGSGSGDVTVPRKEPSADGRRSEYTYVDDTADPESEYYFKVVPFDLGEMVEGISSNNAYVVVTDVDMTPPVWQGPGGILSAVPSDGVIKISFGHAIDEDSPPVRYSLLYAPGEQIGLSEKTEEIRGINGSPYYLGVDPGEGIENDITYFLGVRAYDLLGNETGWETVFTATPEAGLETDITPPVWDNEEQIGAYQVDSGDSQLRVFFGSATDADSEPVQYKVYWQVGNTGVHKTEATGWAFDVTSPYLITDLENDQVYSILATASDSADPANETENTEYMVGVPTTGGSSDLTPPEWREPDQAGIKDVLPGDGDVRVSWYLADDEMSPPVTYNVYWEVNDGTPPLDYETAIAAGKVITGLTSDNVIVPSLTNGQSYRFSVRAQDDATPPNITQNTESLTALPISGADTNPPVWTSVVGLQTATAGNMKVDLSWGNALDLEGGSVTFNFYWETDTGSGPLDYDAAKAAIPPRVGFTSDQFATVYNLANDTSYRFAVRVQDELGNEDTNEVSLTATPEYVGPFTITTAADDGDTGHMPSIAMAPDNSFGVAYFDKGNGALMYASSPVRSGPWTTEIVDDPGDDIHGAFPSLAFDSDSNPRISYLDWTHAEDEVDPGTRVLYIENDGAGWGNVQVVDRAGVDGYDHFFDAPRLTIAPDSTPYVTYVNTTTEEVVISSNFGSGWSSSRPFMSGPGEAPPDGERGLLRAELIFFDAGSGVTQGVAWHDPEAGLSFAYYDGELEEWVTEVVASGNPRDGLLLDVSKRITGEPVIAWQNKVSAPSSRPMFATRLDADDWNVEPVDSPSANNGFSPAVGVKKLDGISAGMPAVAWYSSGFAGARYALDDLANDGFLSPIAIDPTATAQGLFLSIVVDNAGQLPGKSVVAYTAPNAGEFKLNIAVEN